jgi:protein ImuA
LSTKKVKVKKSELFMAASKLDIVSNLRREILVLQGFKPPEAPTIDIGLGPVNAAFPDNRFPTGAIHEFIFNGMASAAASGGFISGILSALMGKEAVCIWIRSGRRPFPLAFTEFQVEPHRIIFFDLPGNQQMLWAMEEALKCETLAAVVGEISDLDFNASRRLQLAVERSRVTGILLRYNPRNLNTIGRVARWHITPLPSCPPDNLPGIGDPRWNVQLSWVKNGTPGTWQMEWQAGHFQLISPELPATRKVPAISGELRRRV